MKTSNWFFAIVAVLIATAAHAQDSRLGDPCKAMPQAGSAAAKAFLTFDRFDKELRLALTGQDPVALSFLVTFPLRVNDAGGTISIDDAAALKTHFQEVFTPAVRKEVLSEKNENVHCIDEGVGYAHGVIWVNANKRGYPIWAVNRDFVPPYPTDFSKTPTINYVCQTQTHRIVVDTLVGGVLRYRAWNKPRPVTETPDLEIAKGELAIEGTQLCAYKVYTFKNGSMEYEIDDGLGCGGYEKGAPEEATGQLEVTLVDRPRPVTESWCY